MAPFAAALVLLYALAESVATGGGVSGGGSPARTLSRAGGPRFVRLGSSELSVCQVLFS